MRIAIKPIKKLSLLDTYLSAILLETFENIIYYLHSYFLYFMGWYYNRVYNNV